MEAEIKEVFLRFDGRNKSIKFQSSKNDWKALRSAIVASSEKDEPLRRKLVPGTVLMFQKEKEKKNGDIILVDVDEDETRIDDEDEFALVFVAPSTSSDLTLQSGHMLTSFSEPSENTKDQTDAEFDNTELQVLHMESLTSAETQPILEVLEVYEMPDTYRLEGPSHDDKTPKLSRKRGTDQVQHLQDPVDLGPLNNATLRGFVDQNLVLAKQSKFYEHYGQQLRILVPDCPVTGQGRTNQQDYDVMAKAICKRHPELANPSHNKRAHGTVAQHLSIAVRNQRSAANKARREASAYDSEDDMPSSSNAESQTKKRKKQPAFKVSAAAASVPNPDVEQEQTDNLKHYQEQLMKSHHTGLSTHVQRLMGLTFESRRTDLKNMNSNSASQILADFPFLQYPDMILHELSLIMKKPAVDLQGAVERLLASLSKWKTVSATNDEEKLDLLGALYKKLRPAKVAKGAKDPVMCLEAMLKIEEELTTRQAEAPRLVVYVDSESRNVVSAFIVADDTVKISLGKRSIAQSTLILIASYHTWYIGYARAYHNFLSFFDEHVFGQRNAKSNLTYQNFQREFSEYKN